MGVEALTLDEDAEEPNSENDIDAVPNQDTKKASSENVEAPCNEYDFKYTIIENIVPVRT